MNKIKKRKWWMIPVVILLIIAIAAVLYIVLQQKELDDEQEVVDIIKQEVVEEPEDDKSGIDKYLLRKIDFDALQAKNSDVTTWLFVPDTNIDSYVMQEPVLNQYKYDHRNIYKQYSYTGSYLIPKEPLDDVEDAHTMILGHNMLNAAKFGNLRRYFGTEGGADSHNYVYTYYPDHSQRWKVYMAVDIRDDDMFYEMPYEYGTEHYGELLEHLEDKSRYIRCDRPDLYTNILCMSTCNRWSRQVLGRFVVVCVPDAMYYYDGCPDYDDKKYIDWAEYHAAELTAMEQTFVEDAMYADLDEQDG